MKQIYILDDWLDKDLAGFITNRMLPDLPIYFNHWVQKNKRIGVHLFEESFKEQVEKQTHGFYQRFENTVVFFMLYKLKKLFNFKFNVMRCYLNVYPPGVYSSEYHRDSNCDTDFSVLYMPSETPDDGSGKFEYIDSNTSEIHKIDYLNNRLIVFNSTVLHRGLSFNDKNRTTLTFKCEKIDENSIDN